MLFRSMEQQEEIVGFVLIPERLRRQQHRREFLAQAEEGVRVMQTRLLEREGALERRLI